MDHPDFADWLRHPGPVLDARKVALKAVLSHLGKTKVADCNDEERVLIKDALGIHRPVAAAQPPSPPRIDMTDAAKAGRADLDIHLDPGSCVVVSSGAYTLRINS